MSPKIFTPPTAAELELVFYSDDRDKLLEQWTFASVVVHGQPDKSIYSHYAGWGDVDILRVKLGPTVQQMTPAQVSNTVSQLDQDYIEDNFFDMTFVPAINSNPIAQYEHRIDDLPLDCRAYTSRSQAYIDMLRRQIAAYHEKLNDPFCKKKHVPRRLHTFAEQQDRFAKTGQGYYLFGATSRLFLDEPLDSRNHIAIPAKALARMDEDEKYAFIESLTTFNAFYNAMPRYYLTDRRPFIIDATGHPLRVLDTFPQTERQALGYFTDRNSWAKFKPLWQDPWTQDEALTATAKPSAISKKMFGPPAPSSDNADTTPTTSTGSTPTSARRKPKLGGVGNIHRLLSRNPAGAFHRLKQMGILGSPQDSDTSSAPLPPSNTTNKPTP